ncbi:hypothetical protein [Bacillus sp. V2I10]|uniref:hypothetical protein n=1 Tax=Bacillus sp. V2I10 TaxID=3042276 RepID=UPI002781750C|nr:hypothetical protein [Bacillus sp. V2I10]MDQ0859397.1 hypothetical protein [Bacillus sp. V2I10]
MNHRKKIFTAALAFSVISAGVVTYNQSDYVNAEKSEQQQQQKQKVRITNIDVLNTMTLQVTFNKPLAAEDVNPSNLENIKKHFSFNHDLSIVNVPQLKIGAKSTYIVPVKMQKEEIPYTLSYKGERTMMFKGTDEKINIRDTRQVTDDTFEIESFREDGVTDYANIIEAYSANRGDQSFELDRQNRDENGMQYEIISSLRDRVVTVTGNNGDTFTANYVPFTQAADMRQAPKFRLPAGETFIPDVTYTVTSEWADVKNATFKAADFEPLNIQSAYAIDNKSLEITLNADPGMELFSGRSIQLKAEDGSTVDAQYRFSSRKGAVGIFDVKGTLMSGETYSIVPLTDWAKAYNVTFTAK